MKFLLSTGCLYDLPIEDVFAYAREAAFDGLELVIDRNFDNRLYLARVAKCASTLPAMSVHAPFVNMKTWGGKVDRLKRAVEVARSLNARIVNFHPPSWLAMEIGFYRWFKTVEDFQKRLDLGPMHLTIENMPRLGKRRTFSPYVLNDIEALVPFAMERNLFFTFDITHLATFGCDTVATFLKIFNTGRLKNIHLSDYSAFKGHLCPGRGDLPIARLLNTARQTGYDELITLEVSPEELPRAKDLLVKVMAFQLSYMKHHAGKD
ncbi:MAG TPA: sugar phosphate isomerase/epimerase [Syntrophorhabdaceae bacterium]|nr:sugar phosphate isomerase/epimerase [Syntrophorhabdaceae bacterium]